MRAHVPVISSAILLLAAQLHAQTNPPSPHKVLTPEQMAYQQQYQSWLAHHQQLQVRAKDLLEKETASEKAGDCTEASTTYDFNICFGKLADTAEENLKSYEATIHDLLGPSPQPPGAPPEPTHGPAGPVLTATQLIAELDTVETAFRQYREAACSAAFHQFGGGTGGPAFEAQCDLHLTRNHLRELDMIYGIILHN